MPTTTSQRQIIAATALASAIGVLCCSLTSEDITLAIAGSALVLFLPGFSLLIAIDIRRQYLSPGELIIFSLGSSCALAIIAGLVLDQFFSLDRDTWITTAAVVISLCLLIALVRTFAEGDNSDLNVVGQAAHEGETADTGSPSSEGTFVGSLTLRGTVALLLALVLTVAAIAVSQESVTANNAQVLELWIVPKPASAGVAAPLASIGLTNLKKVSVDVTLTIREGQTSQSIRIRHIRPGRSWTRSVARKGESIVVTARYSSHPTMIVGTVNLK